MKIGFIGAGKVGFSLGRYFCEKGLEVSGYYSRSLDSAQKAAEFTQTHRFKKLKDIVAKSDTLFITTPDDEIGEVWDYIRQLPIENKIICHCSGSLASTVFSDIESCKAYGYSIHPLYAISSKEESYKQLGKAYFTLEGSKEKIQQVEILLKQLGNPYQIILSEYKALYHLAAVTVSNQVIALMKQGIQFLEQCGFEKDMALEALGPLIQGNIGAVYDKGTIKALTGPMERGDLGTITKHLDILEGYDKILYCLLSLKLLSMAEVKNPHQDYDVLKQLLEADISEKYSVNF